MKQTKETQELVNTDSNGLMVIDVSTGHLPDLEDAVEIPLDIMSDYWTPEKAGESKRVYFDCIKHRKVLDQQNPEIVIDLPCAHFYEKINGDVKTISNGSKRLVGALEANNIQRGTALLVTYLGKKKNASNSFHSDQWSIKPLIVKVNG